MAKKLTAARREMLEQLRREPGYYAPYYAPLKWALENGFALHVEGRTSDRYEITDAGRRVLVAGEA